MSKLMAADGPLRNLLMKKKTSKDVTGIDPGAAPGAAPVAAPLESAESGVPGRKRRAKALGPGRTALSPR